MSDSIDDSIRRALEAHEEGVSAFDAPTIQTQRPEGSTGGSLGALPGHSVERLIARGGMGAVYLARQEALEREVAVKVMTSDAESPEMAARFRREALVLGKLAHPNIVPVYDVGTDDEGGLFYTMKLVKGRTLQAILHDLRREDAEALKEHTLVSLLTVFQKLCDAMAFAHSQGIIHRDLKPENIMVGEFGEVLVMDWGLAKTIRLSDKETLRGGGGGGSDQLSVVGDQLGPAEAESLNTDHRLLNTLQGQVMGTPQYMSPEQARGEIDELDERSDIFSLGGILYAILTLRAPVEGKTLQEVLEKVKSGEITSPTELVGSTKARGQKVEKGVVLEAELIKPLPHLERGRVPLALSSVAMKALALDKVDRYAAVEDLSSDIERFQSGFATEAEQAGLAKQLGLLIQRNKGVFGMAAAALVLLSISVTWFVVNLQAKEKRAVVGEQAALAAKAVALSKEKETSQALVKSAMSLAEASLREGNEFAMSEALMTVPAEERDSTWRYLMRQADSSFAVAPPEAAGVSSPSNALRIHVAPHPKLPSVFAFVSSKGDVRIRNIRTHDLLFQFTVPDLPNWIENCRVAFSPDGETIAVGFRGTKPQYSKVSIHAARTGQRLIDWELPHNGTNSVRQPCFSFTDDGTRLLLDDGGFGSVDLWDATTGELVWRYSGGGKGTKSALMGIENQALVCADWSEPLLVLDLKDGSTVRSLSNYVTIEFIVDELSRYAWIAKSGLGESAGEVINLSNGKRQFSFGIHGEKISDLAFASTGDRLFSVAALEDGRQSLCGWDTRSGRMLYRLMGATGTVSEMVVHPLSGELLVLGSNTRAWDVEGAPQIYKSPRVSASSIGFLGEDQFVHSAGGRRVVVVEFDCVSSEPKVLWKGDEHEGITLSAVAPRALVGRYSSRGPVHLLQREGDEVQLKGEWDADTTGAPWGAWGTRGAWGALTDLRLSPDGTKVAYVVGPSALGVLEASSGKLIADLSAGLDIAMFHDCAWLNESQLLGLVTRGSRRGVGSEKESLLVFDASSGGVIREFEHGNASDWLAVEPGGARFADAGTDKWVRIRDAESFEETLAFRAHDAPITALAWHPTLPVLATGSKDLTLRLWDLESNEMIAEIRGPTAAPNTLAFSPSGNRLGCASEDGISRVWDVSGRLDKKHRETIGNPRSAAEIEWYGEAPVVQSDR